jgi:hypothetical protein
VLYPPSAGLDVAPLLTLAAGPLAMLSRLSLTLAPSALAVLPWPALSV